MSRFDEFAKMAEEHGRSVQSGDDIVEFGIVPLPFLEKAESELAHYAEGYECQEAYLWIGDDGHGKNGAPYHIADIVKEMECCLESTEALLHAVRRHIGGRDD